MVLNPNINSMKAWIRIGICKTCYNWEQWFRTDKQLAVLVLDQKSQSFHRSTNGQYEKADVLHSS